MQWSGDCHQIASPTIGTRCESHEWARSAQPQSRWPFRSSPSRSRRRRVRRALPAARARGDGGAHGDRQRTRRARAPPRAAAGVRLPRERRATRTAAVGGARRPRLRAGAPERSHGVVRRRGTGIRESAQPVPPHRLRSRSTPAASRGRWGSGRRHDGRDRAIRDVQSASTLREA